MSVARQSGDEAFRHYSWKHRIIAWTSQNLFDHFVYTVRHGLLVGMKRKGGLGWLPGWVSRGAETREEQFWGTVNFSGKTVYDVGAFQGLLTMFFARTARQVISYEPNSMNRTRLLDNLPLNNIQNVTVRPFGLGSEPKAAEMVYSRLMSGGASVDEQMSEHLRQSADTKTESIQITTLDDDIRQQHLPQPDFIKIDVEGWELEVLKGATRTLEKVRPALFLEMHGQTMNEKKRKVAELVNFLTAVGYSEIWHVETGSLITPATSEMAAEGHLYCPGERA
jgi:FkbM family methyltransferase